MRHARWSIFVLLCLWPLQVTAGAWPRAEGETFLSFAIESEFENGITDGQNLFSTLYLEHGLTSRLTLGLDAGGHVQDLSKAIGFLQWPLKTKDGPAKMTAQFGLGYFDGDFAIRPGLSWGRGISPGSIGGWLAVDTRAAIQDGFDTVVETDFTLGLKPAEKSMIILQVQTTASLEAGHTAKFAPSYVYELKPGRHLEIGMTAGIVDSNAFNLKFGLWRRF